MLLVDEKTKKAYMSDNVEKQIRVVFPNGEHEDITNEKIEAKSFTFTESLCSRETLKFGLCEANVISFTAECGNIKGFKIEAYIDAYYEGEVYTISYGVFTVSSCKRRAGTHLRQVEAYSESITENDNTLTPFQDWKLQNSIAYAPGTINYGFEKLRSEISGDDGRYEWKDNLRLYTGSIGYDTQTNYRQFMHMYELTTDTNGNKKYVLRYGIDVTFYRFIEHVIYSEEIYPYIYDFNNENRIYKCEYTLNKEAFRIANNICKRYICLNSSKANPPLNTEVKEYNLEETFNPQFALTTYRVTDDGARMKNRLYKMVDGGVYYPYLPNVGQGNSSAGRISFFRFPYSMTIWEYDNNGIAINRTSYDLSNTENNYKKNRMKYAEITEVLPTIPIDITREIIDEEELTRYVVSDEFMEKTTEFNLVNGFLELQGLFGKCGRSDNWEFFNINDNFALYPQDVIYPNGELYPVIASKNFQPLATVSYKNADYEEFEVHKYGYVRATYLATDNEKYSITVECDPKNDNVYEMRDNYILLNNVLDAEIVKTLIKEVFYPNIKDIVYNPARVSIKGLPFLEAGDVIKVYADEGSFKTFLFRKTLSGEQSLNETIDAKGKERHENADKWISVVDVIEKE